MDTAKALNFFNNQFNKQDAFLKSKGLKASDLDKMNTEEFNSINKEWRKTQNKKSKK